MRFSSILVALTLAGCSEYDFSREKDPPEQPEEEPEEEEDPTPQPDIEVDPEVLPFGWWPTDCTTEPQTVTVTNVGEANLDVTDISLDGEGYGAFAHDGEPTLLGPGESFDFEVTFTPLTYTDYDIDVLISSNDPDEPVTDVAATGQGSEDAMMEEVFEQPAPGAVDVLWVVDNSCSMGEEVERLGDSFGEFMDSFTSMGLDYQIGTTTTDMTDTTQQGRLQGGTKIITPATADARSAFLDQTNLGSSGSGLEQGLDAAYAALTDPLISGENAGLVREDAVLAVVIISDEDDQSNISSSDFVTWLEGYKGDPAMTSLSAIVGPYSGLCFDWGPPPTEADAAPTYIDTALATGGDNFDICALDFDQVLAYLGYTAAGLSSQFVLADTPSSVAGITVTIDGTEIGYGYPRWTWDPSANAVVFYPESIPGPEATIVITYPVDAGC